MGNPNSKSSFKNNSINNEFNFVSSDSFSKKGNQSIQQQDKDNNVLTKFTWSYGGMSVSLSGSFNNWKKKIPMDRNGQQFSVTLLLPRLIHQYKFIVDGEWRFSPEDPTMPDDNGHINNYIDTTKFEPIMKNNHRINNTKNDQSGQIDYQQQRDKTNKKVAGTAPVLPPYYQVCSFLERPQRMQHQQYKNIINNPNIESQLNDDQIRMLFTTSHGLPVPTHAQLGHIIRSQNDLYNIIGVTQRCQQKYTTYRQFSINNRQKMT